MGLFASHKSEAGHASEGQVAIVTGGAHGTAESEARLFPAEGARVIVADILDADAEIVAADIRAGGQEATAAKIDVTSEAEWIALIAKAMAIYTSRQASPVTASSRALDADEVVTDGEVIAPDQTGRPQFYDLLRRTRKPAYVAFDLLWLKRHRLASLAAQRAPPAAAGGSPGTLISARRPR